jgi:hypothetical protein
MWLNIGYLRNEVRIRYIREYFKPACNYLYSEAQIRYIEEYFRPVRNCIHSKV